MSWGRKLAAALLAIGLSLSSVACTAEDATNKAERAIDGGGEGGEGGGGAEGGGEGGGEGEGGEGG